MYLINPKSIQQPISCEDRQKEFWLWLENIAKIFPLRWINPPATSATTTDDYAGDTFQCVFSALLWVRSRSSVRMSVHRQTSLESRNPCWRNSVNETFDLLIWAWTRFTLPIWIYSQMGIKERGLSQRWSNIPSFNPNQWIKKWL